jgi:predicted nucleic acid-binding protein
VDKEMGPLVSGCVIDTNILIYHLAGVLTDQAEAILAEALESGSYISIITRIELLGWRKHSPDSLKAAEALLQSMSEIPLHEEIIRLCISFRQNYPIKLPDAIIAATARHTKIPLMTRNAKDFERVSDLKMVDPFSQTTDQ